MPRGKFIMGALSVDRLEVYLGRKRNRLRLAGFGTFLPGPKMEGFRLAQNPTKAPWYISTYTMSWVLIQYSLKIDLQSVLRLPEKLPFRREGVCSTVSKMTPFPTILSRYILWYQYWGLHK